MHTVKGRTPRLVFVKRDEVNKKLDEVAKRRDEVGRKRSHHEQTQKVAVGAPRMRM